MDPAPRCAWRQAAQIAWMRVHVALDGGEQLPGGPNRAVKSMGRKVRRAAKPLCISQTTERASARVRRISWPQSWDSRSAMNSAMASESQMRSPSSRTGTLPEGE